MIFRKIFIATSLFALSTAAQADALSLTVGGGIWNATPDGTFNKITDPASINV